MYTTDPSNPPIYPEMDSSSLHHPLAYSVPLYIQIADRLVSQIESGELAPGDRLPAERELSENLGVNRMTLRRALRVLESQGLVLRKHGIGTFVGEPKIDRQMDVVFRFTRRMQNRGYTPGTQVISLDETLVDAALSRQMAVPVSSPAYKILRLRSINHEPVMIESYIIPVRRFPRVWIVMTLKAAQSTRSWRRSMGSKSPAPNKALSRLLPLPLRLSY
jgi:GntR family transcriptional regulator